MNVPLDILIVCICLSAVFAFYWGYRIHTARSGILTVDIFVMSQIIVPIICFAPFAFSPENSMSTGLHFYRAYVTFVPSAFYISLLGVLTFVIAACFVKSIKARAPGFAQVEASFLGYWLTFEGCVVLFVTNSIILISLIVLGGDPTRLRYTVQDDTLLRPLLNIMNAITSMGLPMMLVCGHIRKDRRITVLAVVMAAATASSGTRAPVIGGMINYLAIRIIAARDTRVVRSAVQIAIALTLLAISSLALESLREGEDANAALSSALPRFLYGNNISDVRDFAWVMSRWDGQPLFGRTYISGALALIPSHFFPWRREWAWAPFSTEASGMGSNVKHSGLRPGHFGEAYFNFGFFGVIVLGILVGGLFGMVLRGGSKRELSENKAANAVVVLCQLFYLENLVLPLSMSAGLYTIYLAVFLVGFGMFMKKARLQLWPTPKPRSTSGSRVIASPNRVLQLEINI
jgi:oligosaccharide repeat unit polymerase